MVVSQFKEVGGKKVRIAHFAAGQYTTDSNSSGMTPIDPSGHPYSNITIFNNSASTVYVGTANVTALSGVPLPSGGSMTIASSDPDERVILREVFVTGGGTSGLLVGFWGVG